MTLIQKIKTLAITSVAISATGAFASYYTKAEDKKEELVTPEMTPEVKSKTPARTANDWDFSDLLGTTPDSTKTNLDWF